MKKASERRICKKQKAERLCKVEMATVFDAMGKGEVVLKIADVKVKIASIRLKTFFVKGQVCIGCGLKATFFAVERHKKDAWHLNLYGIDSDGDEVLFTHDHVYNRAAGGANDLTNTETMCFVCNLKKSVVEAKEGAVLKHLHLVQDAWRETIVREPKIAELMDYEKRLQWSIQFEEELKGKMDGSKS